jgi:hypothetical protein
MRLYTVCAHDQPVLVISAGVEPSMEELAKFAPPEVLKAEQFLRSIVDEETQRAVEWREIDEALDTWLGAELQCLEHDFHGVWGGDRSDIVIREATTNEAARWRASLQDAIAMGEQDTGNEDWLVYLIPVSETDDDWDYDENKPRRHLRVVQGGRRG